MLLSLWELSRGPQVPAAGAQSRTHAEDVSPYSSVLSCFLKNGNGVDDAARPLWSTGPHPERPSPLAPDWRPALRAVEQVVRPADANLCP